MALLVQRGMKRNWQNACYQRNTNITSIATGGFSQESGRKAYKWSFAMFLDPGTQGYMRLEATGSYSWVAAAWMRISSWDKVVERVFFFSLHTNPVERAGGVRPRPCVREKHVTVPYTGGSLHHPDPSFARDLQRIRRAPPHFCKFRPTASGCSLRADSQEALINR